MKKRKPSKELHKDLDTPITYPNQENKIDNNNKLMDAYNTNSLEDVKSALETGADPDFLYEHGSLIFYSIAHKKNAITKLLIEHKANLNLKGPYGFCPLDFAFAKDVSNEVIKLLILNKAKFSNDIYAIDLFTSYIKTPNKEMVVFLLQKFPELLNSFCTALYIKAINNPDKPLIEFLINIDLPINIKTNQGLNPLDYITHNGDPEIIKLMINNGAKFSDNKFCNNMLMGYIYKNNVEMVNFLLQAEAHPNIIIDNGNTPIHIAINNNSLKMLEVLFNNGMSPDFTALDNPAPLILAIQKNNVKIAKMLLERGANYKVKDKAGLEALELAKTLDYQEIVDLISLQQNISTFFLVQNEFILSNFSSEVLQIPEMMGQQEDTNNDN